MNPARLATAVVLATTGGLLTAVTAPASAATTCASPVYQRQIFANTTFSGTPKQTGCDAAVSENWGTGAPAAGVPSNNFGVRWTVTRDFGSGGPFSFTASAQDGVRVHVDGVRKIDLWRNVSSTVTKTVNVTIPSGKHTLRIDYVNWTGTANVKFTYTPRTSATVDKVKPLAPTEVGAIYEPATNRAVLAWAKNKEMDLAGYHVYRRPAGSSTWTKLVTTTANTHTDRPPTDGRTYWYEIRAFDKAGNVSAGSADRGITSDDRVAPAAPTGITVASTSAANTLSWPAVPTATRYEVFRADTLDGTYTRLGTPSPTHYTSYTDHSAPADVPVFYKVRALDAAENASPLSRAVVGTRDTVAPGAPQNLQTAAQDEAGVTLTWLSGGSDAVRYHVYRTPSSGGATTRIATPTGLSYRDTTGDPGQPYLYFVAAVDAAGNESSRPSTTATRTVGPSSAPKAPGLGVARIVGDRMVLDWSQSGHVPVARYIVYRSRTAPVDTSNPDLAYAGTTDTSYTSTVTASEHDYFYSVVAVSAYGVRSLPSNSVQPVVSEVQPPQPTQVQEVTPGDGQVQLVWGSVPIGPGEPEITGYRVYRSTTPGVTKADAEAVFTVAGDRYTDTGLTNGTTYYYAVASVNAAGLESTLSPEVSATPDALAAPN
ncbi:fibronectin type III domain-containing protein [Streptomyces sp. A012304]|uniref:fibronectin type III domain-containing protein n=1 Tax=Streptomyces sp. A012304 TaxID=375446 RepID=UPI002231B1E6|nr:fibronectin type III domain-containing protein [Streptomyces sp. A012304]GKQ39100.1 hypothetical protein ALMP_56290 [Streptomyces sp. A012304]